MTKPIDREPSTIVVGTDAGIFLADPADESAAHDLGPLLTERGSVRTLAAGRDGELLFAGFGLRGSGLFASGDGGRTWKPFAGWPEDRDAWSVAARRDGTLFVGSQPADIWSQDSRGGWSAAASVRAIPERAHWDFIAPPYEAHVLHIAERPERPGTWAAAIEQGGVIESDDDGGTWRQTSPVWDAHRVVFARDGTLLAATGDGLHRRRPGHEWEPAGVEGYVTGLTRDDAGTLYLANGDGDPTLSVSRDDGASWQTYGPEHIAPPDFGVHALAAVPGAPGRLIHGAGEDVWEISPDGARKLASRLPTVRRLLVVTDSGASSAS